MAEEVVQAITPFLVSKWGNPSSSHFYGQAAKSGLENARAQVQRLVNARSSSEIIFMSNGTETINHTLFGCAKNFEKYMASIGKHGTKGHVITQKTEHVAVLETCKVLYFIVRTIKRP